MPQGLISSGAFGPTGGFGPAGLARCLARRALRARLLGRPEAGLKPLPVSGLPPLTFSGNHTSLNDSTLGNSGLFARPRCARYYMYQSTVLYDMRAERPSTFTQNPTVQ